MHYKRKTLAISQFRSENHATGTRTQKNETTFSPMGIRYLLLVIAIFVTVVTLLMPVLLSSFYARANRRYLVLPKCYRMFYSTPPGTTTDQLLACCCVSERGRERERVREKTRAFCYRYNRYCYMC